MINYRWGDYEIETIEDEPLKFEIADGERITIRFEADNDVSWYLAREETLFPISETEFINFGYDHLVAMGHPGTILATCITRNNRRAEHPPAQPTRVSIKPEQPRDVGIAEFVGAILRQHRLQESVIDDVTDQLSDEEAFIEDAYQFENEFGEGYMETDEELLAVENAFDEPEGAGDSDISEAPSGGAEALSEDPDEPPLPFGEDDQNSTPS